MTAEKLPPWQASRLATLLDALSGTPISDAEQASLSWLCGFEAHTVNHLAAVIRRAQAVILAKRAARETDRYRRQLVELCGWAGIDPACQASSTASIAVSVMPLKMNSTSAASSSPPNPVTTRSPDAVAGTEPAPLRNRPNHRRRVRVADDPQAAQPRNDAIVTVEVRWSRPAAPPNPGRVW